MPPDTETKPKHETWLDWMPEGAPEPDVMSRDELIYFMDDLLEDRS